MVGADHGAGCPGGAEVGIAISGEGRGVHRAPAWAGAAASSSSVLRPRRRIRSSTSGHRSEEPTSELQSLMRISYAVFCLKKKKRTKAQNTINMNDKKNN